MTRAVKFSFLFAAYCLQICQTADSTWQAVEGAIMGMILSLVKCCVLVVVFCLIDFQYLAHLGPVFPLQIDLPLTLMED